MTQVPRPLSRSDAGVVPESAIAPADPSTARTAPATTTPALPDDLHNALALAIYKAGIPLPAASVAAEAIAARPKLLDALVAYRQQQDHAGFLVGEAVPDLTRWIDTASSVLHTEFTDARAELGRLEANEREDYSDGRWRIYALTDITERPK